MIWVGTSGFQYPEWRGIFFPDKISPAKMLAFYAEHFPTTEINYTFRHMPSAAVLERWGMATPPAFKFSLKAPQEVTHFRRLKNCGDLVAAFAQTVQALGSKLGPVLVQLPPNFAKDLPILADFLALAPRTIRLALEFRHPSWLDDEVFSLMRSQSVALCVADSERMTIPTLVTAEFGYFRLRDTGYKDVHLAQWADAIAQVRNRLTETFVYFKHEETGVGPQFARRLMELLADRDALGPTRGNSRR
jgi:uncharacterized protein YecE (DUF72 family)